MAERRVIDIYPPKKKEVKELFSVTEEPEVAQEELKIETSKPRPKKNWLKLVGTTILLIVVAFFLFGLSKANIKIWPETEVFDLKIQVKVADDVSDVNLNSGTIPGVIFEVEKQVSETFLATGKATKEGKAGGMITIFNEYSTNSQTLIVNTRFISTDGKLFRTPKAVVIAGGHYEGGKLIPGQTTIRVVADESGVEYNIGPSTFSIPGFAGSDRYTKFYAKSSESMTGGFLEGAFLVTEDDLKEAEDSLSQRAEQEAERSLLAELESDNKSAFLYVTTAVQTELGETFSLAKVGTEAKDFNYQAKAKSKTLIFRKVDLEDFVKQYVFSKAKEGSLVYEDSLEIDFSPESIDLASGSITLSLDISTTAFTNINIDRLKEMVLGKSLIGTKVFLENQEGIVKAEVDFWPFWVKTAPKDKEKIEIKLKID